MLRRLIYHPWAPECQSYSYLNNKAAALQKMHRNTGPLCKEQMSCNSFLTLWSVWLLSGILPFLSKHYQSKWWEEQLARKRSVPDICFSQTGHIQCMCSSSHMGTVSDRTSGFKRVTRWHQWGTGYWHSERLCMREEFSRGFPMAAIPSTYQMALQNTSGSFVFFLFVNSSWFICEPKGR